MIITSHHLTLHQQWTLKTTTKIKKSPFIKFFTFAMAKKQVIIWVSVFLFCFVYTYPIPCPVLPNVDIIFAILSVMSSWKKNRAKKTKTYGANLDKKAIGMFCCSARGDNNFYCQISDLNPECTCLQRVGRWMVHKVQVLYYLPCGREKNIMTKQVIILITIFIIRNMDMERLIKHTHYSLTYICFVSSSQTTKNFDNLITDLTRLKGWIFVCADFNLTRKNIYHQAELKPSNTFCRLNCRTSFCLMLMLELS